MTWLLRTRAALMAVVLIGVAAARTAAVDASGIWTSEFDSDIGRQQYRYEFAVKGTTLTGTATGSVVGESEIEDGKAEGNTVSFTERGRFMGSDFRIEYVGTMTSADEIRFERRVIGLVSTTETIVAKRQK